jgi:ribosomal protein S18 acetylase RimI-like enzyme
MPEKTEKKFNGTVRKAKLPDLDTLVDLGKRSFYEAFHEVTAPEDMKAYLASTFNRSKIKNQLSDDRSQIYIAEVASDTAGYVYTQPAATPDCVKDKDAIKLERIYLLNQYYGFGVGDALMQTCIEQSRSRGYKTIWLSSWELNDRANAFYKKWGFKVVGSQKFTVGSDVQNDFILSREL